MRIQTIEEPGVATTAGRLDFVWAAAAGAAAFALYLRTLAPGLVDDVDTAMFQFIGRVLGVAHNPGYPLYVLLTFPFSFLPVGSLSYRINLFSAVMGALTVSLVFLIARRLGCRPIVGLAAALGLAFGHVFWSQAVIAEVYTLHTAIVAGMLLALMAWRQTGRPAYFWTAIALFAAGLGNHTTIVGFAPGIALYAVLTDRRFATRARTLATTAVLLFAGLLQYGFILLRSREPGAYVESRATTIRELIGVMLATQFKDRLFAFDVRDVVLDRFPTFVRHVLAPELTLPGLVLAAAGAAWLVRRRFADALLILGGCVATVVFALNYSVVDTPVFLIAAMLVLWLCAAVGAEQLARLPGRAHWAGACLGVAALMLPAWQLARNLAVNDRSRDTKTAVHFKALFDALPDRAALVREDFLVDRMVMFKLLGDRSAAGRRIEVAPSDAIVLRGRFEDGVKVFGFVEAVWRLRYEALNFSFRPLALMEGRLDESLSRLADGTLVAVAVPSGHAARFAASDGVSFSAIGGPGDLARQVASNVAIVGVRGARRGALVQINPIDVTLNVAAHAPVGDTGVVAPSAIEVRSGTTEAAIRQGARDIVRTSEGAVMAIWGPDGRLLRACVLQASDNFRLPAPPGLSVYPLRGTLPSLQLPAREWTDVLSVLATGSLIVRAPAGRPVVLYVRDDARLAPRIIDRSSDRVRIDVTTYEDGADRALAGRLETDQAGQAGLERQGHVYRIEVTTSGAAPASAFLALGGIPTQAIARVAAPPPSTASVVSVDTDGLLRTPDRASEVLLMARDDQAQLTGDGWSPVDWDDVGPYRWMTGTEARLVLPIGKEAATRIRVQALLGDESAATTMRLRLNGTELPVQSLREGWHAYEWVLPDGAVWQGPNEAAVIVDRLSAPGRSNGTPREVALTEVRVIHDVR